MSHNLAQRRHDHFSKETHSEVTKNTKAGQYTARKVVAFVVALFVALAAVCFGHFGIEAGVIPKIV